MSRRVMVIEDNALHGRLYCAALRASGFIASHLSYPENVLREIQLGDVAALIVDIRLPRVDGRTIIRQIREDAATKALPIVAVSAVADQDMEETCLAAGADRFRAKPVPLTTLARDVGQLIEARGVV